MSAVGNKAIGLFLICGLQKYNCFLECPIIYVLLYHSYEAARSHRADYVSEWRERLFDTEGTGERVR